MKNLLIYIGPEPKFSPEHEVLTKIQIDNSLELGWKPEDILLVTNFDWEYREIKSYKVEGDFRALDGNRSSKIPVILKLFELGLINDLTWFHDHDAFQLEPFLIQVEDAAFTDHGWSKTWNAGSFFFNEKARGLFQEIYNKMLERNTNEQSALTYLWENGLERKVLNITYNLNIYQLNQNIEKADKPLLVAHFHPRKPRHMILFRPFLTRRFLSILDKYELK